MNIRRAQKSDFKEVSKLLNRTFDQFLTAYFTKKEAVKFKNEQLSEEGLLKRMNRIMYIAEENTKIIGFIEGEIDRVRLFFVEKNQQGQGIGKALLKKFEAKAKKTIYVNAALPAVSIYSSLGFKKSTGQRTKNGKQYQPMKKILTK